MLDRFLSGPWQSLVTHIALASLTALLFALLLLTPWWVALPLGAIAHHRIAILLHEYVHGIPFRSYRHGRAVLSVAEGVFLLGGLLEVFRATHLAHHRWLNAEGDPAVSTSRAVPKNLFLRALAVTEAPQLFRYLGETIRGERPYVKRGRIALGMVLTIGGIVAWSSFGHGDTVLKLFALHAWTGVVSSMRGAVEHHGPRTAFHSTNEYRPILPIFNLNRHVHHHAAPRCPWYRLRYMNAPLPRRCFLTSWWHVYVRRDFMLLPPERTATIGRYR